MHEQTIDIVADSDSGAPLYLQVADALMGLIRNGRWGPSQALPSERKLADLLSVSRVTARKAIGVLCERGMMTRKRGSGNYITQGIEQRFLHLTTFSAQMRERGLTPGSQWLLRASAAPTTQEVVALGLRPNATVARLTRLRTADGVIVAIECSTVPEVYLADPFAVDDSLYDYLSHNALRPVRALQHVTAVNATAGQARLANIEEGAALLLITRIGYLDNGVAVELTRSHCLSAYYDFVAELRR